MTWDERVDAVAAHARGFDRPPSRLPSLGAIDALSAARSAHCAPFGFAGERRDTGGIDRPTAQGRRRRSEARRDQTLGAEESETIAVRSQDLRSRDPVLGVWAQAL